MSKRTGSVTVTGTSSSGQTVIPETTAGQHTSCQVKLTTAPAAGTYTVVATVARRLVPNCSAAIVVKTAQYPMPIPSPKITV